jgi:hypothetical protein
VGGAGLEFEPCGVAVEIGAGELVGEEQFYVGVIGEGVEEMGVQA